MDRHKRRLTEKGRLDIFSYVFNRHSGITRPHAFRKSVQKTKDYFANFKNVYTHDEDENSITSLSLSGYGVVATGLYPSYLSLRRFNENRKKIDIVFHDVYNTGVNVIKCGKTCDLLICSCTLGVYIHRCYQENFYEICKRKVNQWEYVGSNTDMVSWFVEPFVFFIGSGGGEIKLVDFRLRVDINSNFINVNGPFGPLNITTMSCGGNYLAVASKDDCKFLPRVRIFDVRQQKNPLRLIARPYNVNREVDNWISFRHINECAISESGELLISYTNGNAYYVENFMGDVQFRRITSSSGRGVLPDKYVIERNEFDLRGLQFVGTNYVLTPQAGPKLFLFNKHNNESICLPTDPVKPFKRIMYVDYNERMGLFAAADRWRVQTIAAPDLDYTLNITNEQEDEGENGDEDDDD